MVSRPRFIVVDTVLYRKSLAGNRSLDDVLELMLYIDWYYSILIGTVLRGKILLLVQRGGSPYTTV